MKRNSFFRACTVASVALPSIVNSDNRFQRSSMKKPQKLKAVCANGTLAGNTLEELRDNYLYYLNEYKEFQHKYVVDREYGGYCINTDWDGPPLSYEKSTSSEGRGTWTFSFLYNNIDPDPRHIEAARRSVEFILKHKPEEDVFFSATYTREGKPCKQGTDISGDMYLADGLAEFSKVPENEKYWDIAKDIMLKCVRIIDKPGYSASELTPKGSRFLGNWFDLIRVATQMLESRDDSEIKAIADRCIDAQMKCHYNPDYGLYNERINFDFTRPNNELAQHGSLGYATAMLWMTMYEAIRRNDKALFDENAKRFRRNIEVAWDDVYGGVFTDLRHIDENRWELGKAGWGQMENLIGLLCIIEHTGAEWSKQWFDKLYTWTMTHFPLKPYGLPLWQDYTNRKALFVKGDRGRRAENLHYPRYLMLNLLAVERIMKRDGNISDVFARYFRK